MAKKKFTNNLEDLFGPDPVEESFQENNPLLSPDMEEGQEVLVATPKAEVKKPKPQRLAKRRSSKNFSSGLESLFQDALQDAFNEKMAEDAPLVEVKEDTVTNARAERRERRRRRPVLGLDSLIRRTTDISEQDLMNPSAVKRVTFVYDRDGVERLKEIAKERNLYMKDLIGKVVSDWIQEYEGKPNEDSGEE